MIPDNIKAQSLMFAQRPSTDSRSPATPVEDARSAAAAGAIISGQTGWDEMRWIGMVNWVQLAQC